MADKVVNYKLLGIQIKRRRLQLGLSQNAAAEIINISVSFYSRVERGETVPSLETLIKIANSFEFSLDFLLQDSMKKSVLDKQEAELAQILTDKTPAQAERLVTWLKMLSENIGILS